MANDLFQRGGVSVLSERSRELIFSSSVAEDGYLKLKDQSKVSFLCVTGTKLARHTIC